MTSDVMQLSGTPCLVQRLSKRSQVATVVFLSTPGAGTPS